MVRDLYFDEDDIATLRKLEVVFLDDSYIGINGLIFGGLSSPYKVLAGTGDAGSSEEHKMRWNLVYDNFNFKWLEEYSKLNGVKILLSHHPEIYDTFLKNIEGLDLILSGHAHGGQIRLFGKGLYAHGQGYFPKYTSGMYDNRLIVSCGLANTSHIPRINNPREVVYITLSPI